MRERPMYNAAKITSPAHMSNTPSDGFHRRLAVLAAIAIAGIALLVARMVWLQVLS
jgi:hypothetical protein